MIFSSEHARLQPVISAVALHEVFGNAFVHITSAVQRYCVETQRYAQFMTTSRSASGMTMAVLGIELSTTTGQLDLGAADRSAAARPIRVAINLAGHELARHNSVTAAVHNDLPRPARGKSFSKKGLACSSEEVTKNRAPCFRSLSNTVLRLMRAGMSMPERLVQEGWIEGPQYTAPLRQRRITMMILLNSGPRTKVGPAYP
jgi:hypothetical protein